MKLGTSPHMTMACQFDSQEIASNISLATNHLCASWIDNAINPSTHNGDNIDAFEYIDAFSLFPLWKLNITLYIIYASGSIANSLLLAYLLYYKRYKSPVFCAILSLCIADLGMCIASLFWLSANPVMSVPPWMCNPIQILMHVSFTTSSYHMAVFAALRFLQLVYPLAARAKITLSIITKICLSIWTADFIQAFILTTFFKATEVEYNNETIYVCWFQKSMVFLSIWVAVTWVVLPFLTTAGIHLSKHMILICTRSSIVITSSSEQKSRTQTDSRALAVVVSLYLITILPVVVQYARYALLTVGFSYIDWILYVVFENIAFINSSINPWIYMFAAESVRSDIRKICVQSEK